MKPRILVALILIVLTWASTSRAQNVAVCPPVSPNSGVSSTTVPPWSGGGTGALAVACDYGLTVNTSMVILQGPVTRHFFKITNTSAIGGGNLGICFTRLELATNACTINNAGTLLTPGQSFYQGVAMYGGLTAFNSMFFQSSIELIGSTSGVTVAASIN
jgi:hypothetical protein